MSGQSESPELTFGLQAGLKGLSRHAARFVRNHPRQAQMAVTAALEAAALFHYEAEDISPSSSVPAALRPFLVAYPSQEEMLGVSEAARRLKISRTTVYDWVAKQILLGWKSTKRGLVIPAEQILEPGKVVPGLSRVRAIIKDPELAWAFLSQEWPFADETARPIDKLKAGRVEQVLDAASSFGSTFT